MNKIRFLFVLSVLTALMGCVTIPEPGGTSMPSLSITGPATGDTVNGPVLSVTGTSGESYGVGIEGVYADLDNGGFGKVIGTVSWATNYRNLTNGNHSVQVFSKSYSGLTSTTNTVSLLLTNCSVTNTNNWTIMIYLDGDNNLEPYAIWDFQEMERGLLKAINSGSHDAMNSLNIIVLFDRYPGLINWATEPGGSDWSDTRLYRVLPNNDPNYFGSERLDDANSSTVHHINNLGSLDMGSTNTLKWFIGYSLTNYPAQNYALVLWDHGSGAMTICQDFTSNNDALYIDEVRQSLAAYPAYTNKLRMIGFDACYMSMVENAYEFRDVANYMVASMRDEDFYGWDYENWFGRLHGSGDPKTVIGSDLSKFVVDSYRDFHENKGDRKGDTLSAIDLSYMNQLKLKIDAFAAKIYYESNKTAIESIRETTVNYYKYDSYTVIIPNYDLNDLANKIYIDTSYGFSANLKNAANDVMDALANSVVYSYGGIGNGQLYYYGSGSAVKKGLSIFFSRGDRTYNESSSYYTRQGTGSGTYPQFYFQWWYTSTNVSSWWPGHYYGNLDFCDSDSDGVVETWRELLKAWYDPVADLNTPGSY